MRRARWAAALLVAVTLALLVARPEPARGQQAAPDTVEPDSVFRRAGPVLHWQVVARELLGADLAARARRPSRARFYDGNNNTRLYALLAGAQYDALRAASGPLEREAAAATAAAAVLRAVFATGRPALGRVIDRAAAGARADLRARGLPPDALRIAERAGRSAAARWVRDAQAELRTPSWRGTVPTTAGSWRSGGGPPGLAISLNLRPWFLGAADQLRPPPPPAAGSPELAAALAEVRAATEQRTRAQTRATWAYSRNAATLWSEIAGRVILRERLTEPEAARALMYLNMALSDATIACWDAKLSYWLARPSQEDPTLDLSIPLPNLPSYPSAHATLFAAGAGVLGHLVPTARPALDSIAAEATSSRLWAGVHYRFDNEAGTRLGQGVAALAIAVADAEAPAAPPVAR